jgi:hypothetical protein
LRSAAAFIRILWDILLRPIMGNYTILRKKGKRKKPGCNTRPLNSGKGNKFWRRGSSPV